MSLAKERTLKTSPEREREMNPCISTSKIATLTNVSCPCSQDYDISGKVSDQVHKKVGPKKHKGYR